MTSDTKNIPASYLLAPEDFIVARPEDPGVTGLDDVCIRSGGNLYVASKVQDEFVKQINKILMNGNGWHVITIPPTKKDGISYPELIINSHLLSCQKLCEKASGS